MILAMLNQRRMFKSTKYKKTRENVYNKKKLVVWLVNQRLFFFKLWHLTYQKYCVEFMFRLFIVKDFEWKGGRERQKKKKKRKYKIMINVEYINERDIL